MKNKTFRIIKKYVTTILIVIIIILMINEIVYAISIPEEFKSSYLSGKWSSSKCKLISGKILISIQPHIFENSKFNGETLLYYNIWSLNSPGKIKIMEIDGAIGRPNFKIKNQLEKEKIDELGPYASNYFKAVLFSAGKKIIEYTGMRSKDSTIIIGDYKCFDKEVGSFELKIGG